LSLRPHDDHVDSLETELARARDLDEDALADAIETIGFECTRCGACCKANEAPRASDSRAPEPRDEVDDPHTATVFPDEVRELRAASASADGTDTAGGDPDVADATVDDGAATSDGDAGAATSDGAGEADSVAYDWRDVARPMPYGLETDADGTQSGETFEWALQTTACGGCTFYEEDANGTGACTVHDDRPLICETYPFSVALGGTSQPLGEAVDEAGLVRAHECEGLGRDIDREHAEELAAALAERAVRELEEAIGVRDNYERVDAPDADVVVHDSEGAKNRDGEPLQPD